MSNEEELIIHVGLPKCGSTFLQKEIFPKLKNINICNSHINTKLLNNKINLISNESLCGCTFNTIQEANTNENINRLIKLFPNAKIIIIFRNKQNWLWSYYKECVRLGMTETYDTFYKTLINKEFLDFEKCKKQFCEAFNEVLILHFEELIISHHNFIKKICTFIGCNIPYYNFKPIRKSIDNSVVNNYRIFNKLFKTKYNRNGFFPNYFNFAYWYFRLMQKYDDIKVRNSTKIHNRM